MFAVTSINQVMVKADAGNEDTLTKIERVVVKNFGEHTWIAIKNYIEASNIDVSDIVSLEKVLKMFLGDFYQLFLNGSTSCN